MKYTTPSFQRLLVRVLLSLSLLVAGTPAQADAEVLHTYVVSKGHEVDHLIAVDAAKLVDLLPAGYALVPASEFGVGSPDQGIVVIINFEGLDPTIDNRLMSAHNRVGVDVTILVTEPAGAAEAGVAFPGAFHFYTLAMYSNDPPYVASLRQAGIPIGISPNLVYQWGVDDVSGAGEVAIDIPTPRSALASRSTAFGFGPLEVSSMQSSGMTASSGGRRCTSTLQSSVKPMPSAMSSFNLAARWPLCWKAEALAPAPPIPRLDSPA